jgi:hypothetical protein
MSDESISHPSESLYANMLCPVLYLSDELVYGGNNVPEDVAGIWWWLSSFDGMYSESGQPTVPLPKTAVPSKSVLAQPPGSQPPTKSSSYRREVTLKVRKVED